MTLEAIEEVVHLLDKEIEVLKAKFADETDEVTRLALIKKLIREGQILYDIKTLIEFKKKKGKS